MSRHSVRHFFYLLFIPFLFSLFFYSQNQSFAAEPVLKEVTLRLNWKHQFEFAGYYAAKEQGYYKDAGLSVIIREFEHGTDVLEEVLSGKAQFGTFYSELFLASMKGKPVSMLANFLKYSPEVLVAHPDIRLPGDLKGKRVMGGGHELHGANLGAMFKKFGISPEEFTTVPHTFTIDAFSAGEVDAMTIFLSNEIYHLNKNNIEYNILSPFSFGIPSYDGNLCTSSAFASSDPDVVRKFRDASIRGWQYAVEHSDELVDLILAKYSQQKSREALQFEAVEIKKAMLHKTIPIGSVSKQQLQSIVTIYKELGLVAESANLDNLIFESFDKPILRFSSEEEKYISERKTLRFCVDPNWMPFEAIDKNGKLIGMSADYVLMLEERIGVPLELVPTKTWNETIAFASTKQCDFITMAMETEERKKSLLFTRPYLNFSEVIATRADVRFIEDIATVLDQKHGVVEGYAHKKFLEKKYPGITINEVADVKDGLQQVQDGKLFSFIGSAAAIAYIIEREALAELRISGEIDHVAHMSIAVRDDDPVLLAILEKVISDIGDEKIMAVYRKWVEVKYIQHIDYSLLWKILAVVIALFSIVLYRNWKLAQFNIQIRDVNKALQKEIAERIVAEEKRCELEKQLFQAQKMESIGLMASGVAHDLNNILSGIVGYPDLLLPGLSEDSELRLPIVAIQESGQRAAAVVADLLTVARGAASIFDVYDIDTLIDEHIHSPECKKLMSLHQGIQCQVQFAARHTAVSCSPVHVRKCLMNLIINAAEAINNKGTIIVTTCNESIPDDDKNKIKTGEYVVVAVQDTGPGISATDLGHIFEPFYTKKAMGRSGSGLGLAVVWNTMEDHSGQVLVDSDHNGTCFRLYFPVSEKKSGRSVKDEKVINLNGNGERILVVDDEKQLCDIATQMLQSKGYMADSVSSGESAIEFVAENQVDLLMLDMIMEPGMNGRQTYEQVLKLFPDQKAIVASGFSESSDVKATLQLGAAMLIKKPYTMDQLARAVKDALSG